MPDLPELTCGHRFALVGIRGEWHCLECRAVVLTPDSDNWRSRALAAEAEVANLRRHFEHRARGIDPLAEHLRAEADQLRADLAALVEALERLVLAGRYINIAPPREDDADRQSDHDEFYAANQAGEVAARAVLDRLKETP